ncbi:hypothetical protein [Streptomyces xanthophaeus]
MSTHSVLGAAELGAGGALVAGGAAAGVVAGGADAADADGEAVRDAADSAPPEQPATASRAAPREAMTGPLNR